MLGKIRYIAAYQSAPVSAITYYVEVDRIEPYADEGYYKLIFKKPATKMAHPIPFGDSLPGLMQGPKYTRFERLSGAKKVADLFN